MMTVTCAVGCVSSFTVYVSVLPSSIVSDVGETVTPAVSSSVTVTVSVVLPTEP